jgi:hypothetical protein
MKSSFTRIHGVCIGAIVLVGISSITHAALIDRQQLINWGLETYGETLRTLRVPGTTMQFAESANLSGTQSGGVGGRAFVWPMSAQFRVQNSLARLDPAAYTTALRQFADELHARYWTSRGGYRSNVVGGSDRYYDDNAHLAVALAEAYQITRDPVYLDRAKATYDFLLEGEDTVGGGGIYWVEDDYSFKDSAATIQGARAALMLHQATGEQRYLTDAMRLYDWARNTTQQSDGLFMEKLFLTGPQAGTVGNFTLVNFAGFGISANLEFYESTGNRAYLSEAQRIANRSLTRYFDGATGRINDEGFWAYELADALVDLHAADGGTRWLDALHGALRYLHDSKEDPNGHYGVFWGRNGPQTSPLATWDLNDMAPVARAYLHTARVPEPAAGGLLLTTGCFAIARRRRTFIRR